MVSPSEVNVYTGNPYGEVHPEGEETPLFIVEAELAETALLGAVLQVPGYPDVHELTKLILPTDFLQPRNAAIWESVLRVHGRGDRPTVMEVLEDMGSLAHRLPGGAVYLHTLMSRSDVLAVHAPRYARRARALSIRRQIADVGARMIQLKDDPDMSEEEFLSRIVEWTDGFTLTTSGDEVDIRTALDDVLLVADQGEPHSIPTPWPDLTDLIGGWRPGQLIVVGARPGVGKSLFIENALTDCTRNYGHHVLSVSMEMTAKEITQRTLSHTAQVLLKRLIAGGSALDDQDWRRIRDASEVIRGQKITFADRKGQTFPQIRSATHAAAQKARRAGGHLGLVGIDYAGLVEPLDPKMLRHLHLGEVSRGAKKMAGDYGTTVILASQLNREGKDRAQEPPRLTDLRESGSLEQDADVVILLHEVMVEDGNALVKTGELEFHVAKSRNGSTGVRSVQKFGHYAKLHPNGGRLALAAS